MQPRVPSSKKWTKFPKSYQDQIEQVFAEAFATQLTAGKLLIEGRIYPEEILLRVGYLENGRLLQNNFEISVNYSQMQEDAVERIHNCIDAAASMMHEFFTSEGEVDFPRVWKNFDFSGQEIWVQYTTDNTQLESEANKLLGVDEDTLLVEEEVGEDALARAEEKLSLDEDADIAIVPKKKKEDLH